MSVTTSQPYDMHPRKEGPEKQASRTCQLTTAEGVGLAPVTSRADHSVRGVPKVHTGRAVCLTILYVRMSQQAAA